MRATVKIYHNIWTDRLSMDVTPPGKDYAQDLTADKGATVGKALKVVREYLEANGYTVSGQFDYNAVRDEFTVTTEKSHKVIGPDLRYALNKLGVVYRQGDSLSIKGNTVQVVSSDYAKQYVIQDD